MHERRRAAPDRPVEAARERRAPLRRRHVGAVGRGGAGARGPGARAAAAARPSRASASPTRPGHASHHVCYLHEEPATPTSGDVAGVRIPPYEHTLAPTPPPDIDVEVWLDSLHTVAVVEPAVALPDPLRPGHRRGRPPAPHPLRAARRPPTPPASTARRASSPSSSSGLAEATDPATVEAFEQAAPPDQLYQGLARYWRKRGGMTADRREAARRGPGDTGLGGHWRVIVLNDDHNTFEGVATRSLDASCPASATTRAWRWPTRSTTRAGRSSGQAPESWPSTTGSS